MNQANIDQRNNYQHQMSHLHVAFGAGQMYKQELKSTSFTGGRKNMFADVAYSKNLVFNSADGLGSHVLIHEFLVFGHKCGHRCCNTAPLRMIKKESKKGQKKDDIYRQ